MICLLLLLGPLLGSAQEIRVKGGFVEDSLVIGQPINFWISATYSPSLEMVFPDSNYAFGVFEFDDKTFFLWPKSTDRST